MSRRSQRSQQHHIRLLLVAEFEIHGCDPPGSALVRLDAFREAARPAAEYGITLYRATAEDLADFGGVTWLMDESPRSHDRAKAHATGRV
jgi:hypothetical protein